MVAFYEAGSIKVGWNGVDLSNGWGEDTFLEITKDGAYVEPSPGADGNHVYSKLSNRGATITMTFKQGSKACQDITKLLAAQTIIGGGLPVSVFTVIDPVGGTNLFIANNAVLIDSGDNSWGNTVGERQFMWHCSKYIETNDPSTVTSSIKDFTA